MKDDPELMTKFVKIVERFPEIYDSTSRSYRTQQAEISWYAIAGRVKEELNLECTVDELKVRWKGIRSSYNRYKSKLIDNDNGNLAAVPCKKYYLYDALKFIDPFTKPKGSPSYRRMRPESVINDVCFTRTYAEVDELSNEYNTADTWGPSDVKPDFTNDIGIHPSGIVDITANEVGESIELENSNKQKVDRDLDDDNEDIQFFRSILPDIKNFTNQEKRKLKIGVLKLIDDLESERKRVKIK